MLGLSSYWRCIYAIRAYRSAGFKKVIVAGGGVGMPISLVMTQFLIFYGIPAEAITAETQSTTTRENALAVG